METHGASSSSNPARPSTHGDVVTVDAMELPVEPRPDEIAGSGALSLAIVGPVAPSQALEEEIAGGASASALGGGHGQQGLVAADDPSGLQITETGNERFVPIKDVQAMLQTGRLEGMQIVYRSKKDKLNLLYGVIRGMSYFCSCGDCDHNGKVEETKGGALSARAFAQHALKTRNETDNPNDHILLCSSNISLFEACRRLKKVTNAATLESTFDMLKQGGLEVAPKNKMLAITNNTGAEATANKKTSDANLIQIVRNLEKRMESAEKLMEDIEGKLKTIDQTIEVLCKEMLRHQELFQDLSKVMGKFVNES
ncbi:hypothetical protein ACP70R_003858 [Stipagrostis hirtigluma subsp. patula]